MSEPIDIPTTKKGVFSYFSWKNEPDDKIKPLIVNEKESNFEEDKGIFTLSSSEGENDYSEQSEQSEQDHSESETYPPWSHQEDRSCCQRLTKIITKNIYGVDTIEGICACVNTMEMFKEYEIVVDKANKDFDKFLGKCTVENFNLCTDAVLKNFASNFHWFLTGIWFYSIQKPNKVFVPIYVSDCGHVCAEI
tara:strand:+ start:11 stop:589 length:579 start_codon:yes stop_codon:yes gene_type:complete